MHRRALGDPLRGAGGGARARRRHLRLEDGVGARDRVRCGRPRALAGRPRPTRVAQGLRSPCAGGVFSCRGRRERHAGALAEVPQVQDQGLRDRLIPDLRAAREVRRRPGRGEPPGAWTSRTSFPCGLLGLIGAIERYDPDPRDQVRDLRDGAYPWRDHRRAPLARLGAALGADARAGRSSARSRRSKELMRAPTDAEIAQKLELTDDELEESPMHESPVPRSPRSTSSGRPRGPTTRSP